MSDQSTTAGRVLDALRPRLDPAAHEAGFVFDNASPPGVTPKADIGLLEYCADRGGQRLWLGFYEDPGGRTVVAELWAPDRLRGDPASLSVDAVAERRLTWHRAPDTSPDALAGTIATEVSTWLALRTRGRDLLTSTAWGRQSPDAGEVGALRLRLTRRLATLQRRLATYHSFDEPGAGETADRLSAVALAIEELDVLLREDGAAASG